MRVCDTKEGRDNPAPQGFFLGNYPLLTEHEADEWGGVAAEFGLCELAACLAFDGGEVLEFVHCLGEGGLFFCLGGGCGGFLSEEAVDFVVGWFAVAEGDLWCAVAVVVACLDGDGEFDFLCFVAGEVGGCGDFGDTVWFEGVGEVEDFFAFVLQLVADGGFDVFAELDFLFLESGDFVGEGFLGGEEFLFFGCDLDGDHVVGGDSHVHLDLVHRVCEGEVCGFVAHSCVPLCLFRTGCRSDGSQWDGVGVR